MLGVDLAAPRADPAAPLGASERVALAAVGVVPILSMLLYVLMGAGYVLDDWYLRANAELDGFWDVAPPQTGQRPLAIPLWGFAFATMAGHPVAGLLLAAGANTVFAVVLVLLARRVLPVRAALLVGFLWAFVPAHLSQELWITCVNIAWSQALAIVGIWIGWRRPGRGPGRLLVAAFCLAGATLSYEATVVVAGLTIVALPWIERRRLDWPLVVSGVGSMGLSFLWVVAHWYEGKSVRGLAPVEQVIAGNLAWPFVGRNAAADVLTIGALALILLAAARVALPSFRHRAGPPERLVLAGVVVMVAGTVPFLLYFYSPLGAGDRVNGLSAVGGSLVLLGAFGMLARLEPASVPVALVAIVLAAGVVRVRNTGTWHLAARDADAILAGIVASHPMPDGVIVVGPAPPGRDNVYAFFDSSNIDRAVRWAYRDPSVRATLTYSGADFERVPEDRRFDVRPVAELDD